MSINYSLDENNQEKINWLCFLATPRILYLVLEGAQSLPFICKLAPSKICHSHLIEHYVFQWSDIITFNPVNLI